MSDSAIADVQLKLNKDGFSLKLWHEMLGVIWGLQSQIFINDL